LILFSLSLGQLDRGIRRKSGRGCLSPGANQVETGDCRSFLENLYFSCFQPFQEVGIYEGWKRGESRIKRPGSPRFTIYPFQIFKELCILLFQIDVSDYFR